MVDNYLTLLDDVYMGGFLTKLPLIKGTKSHSSFSCYSNLCESIKFCLLVDVYLTAQSLI